MTSIQVPATSMARGAAHSTRLPWARQRLIGAFLLLLLTGGALLSSAEAQDRSVSRFGPLVAPDTVQAGPLDLGRIWSFAQPPLEYFQQQYRISADGRGLEHARLGTVRLPGCSGALVSPQGLVLTAARCVQPDANAIASSSFYAEEQTDEKPLEAVSAERVVEVRDVTSWVDSLTADGDTLGEATGRQEEVMNEIQSQLQQETSAQHSVNVVREGGDRYVAYHYRRYEDVRLVFLPDPEVRVTTQTEEVLTYPQYTWDVAVLRIYENGTPLSTESHFDVRAQGARPGDTVFSVGYPETTQRGQTHAQRLFRRDVEQPNEVARLENWTTHLQQYVDTAATHAQWMDHLREGEATLKHVRAQLESLQNPYVMARLKRQDEALRRSGDAEQVSQLMDALEGLQEEKRTIAESYRTFSFLLHPEYSSATLRRAVQAYEAMNDNAPPPGENGMGERSAQPSALDAALLANHLEQLQALDTDPALQQTLDDVGTAAEVVQSSVLSTPDEARAALRNRAIPSDDPALRIVEALYDQYEAFRTKWTRLQTQERRLTDRLVQIRSRNVERPIALPQSRSPRITDGRIQGYPYNGTIAPPFTTFYGLYGRQSASGERLSLPEQWHAALETIDRSTPLTTVSSTDLGGGEYGGPLLNSSLQLVGIVVDGNVQSAARDVLFLPRRMRAVSVDVRGVLEGLSSVYDAESLVQEMTKDSFSSE